MWCCAGNAGWRRFACWTPSDLGSGTPEHAHAAICRAPNAHLPQARRPAARRAPARTAAGPARRAAARAPWALAPPAAQAPSSPPARGWLWPRTPAGPRAQDPPALRSSARSPARPHPPRARRLACAYNAFAMMHLVTASKTPSPGIAWLRSPAAAPAQGPRAPQCRSPVCSCSTSAANL